MLKRKISALKAIGLYCLLLAGGVLLLFLVPVTLSVMRFDLDANRHDIFQGIALLIGLLNAGIAYFIYEVKRIEISSWEGSIMTVMVLFSPIGMSEQEGYFLILLILIEPLFVLRIARKEPNVNNHA